MKKLLLIVFAISMQALKAQICFTPTNYTLSVSGNGNSVTAADFNNDGKKDLAVSNNTSSYNQISIMVNSGNGHFSIANTLTFTSVNKVISADFNNDNNQDLAVVLTDSIALVLGAGNGSFGLPTTYNIGSNASGLIAADFNNDGNADVVTANPTTNNLSILLGTGIGGHLNPASSYSLTNSPQDLITQDFNADGKLDLAVITNPFSTFSSYSVSIYMGTGTGTFSSPTSYYPGNQPFSLSSADFNGDNKPDIAIVNAGEDDMVVLLGNGNGRFTLLTSVPGGSGPKLITCADYDHDGRADMAVANNMFNTVYVYRGKGDGTFYCCPLNYGYCYNPWYMVSADLNGDGHPDLTVANEDNSVSVLLNCSTPPTCLASVTDSLFNISPLNWDILAHYSSQITSATWYWGDGTSTTGFYPSHTYTVAGNYNICVKAKTSCGDSINTCTTDSIYRMANSSMVNVNIVASAPTTMGIQTQTANNNVSIYPNPAGNQIFIDAKMQDKLQVDVYDVNGKHVLSTSVNNQTYMDVSNLSQGVYTLNVSSVNFSENKKLVIIK